MMNGLYKVWARRVPKMLTEDQIRSRLDISVYLFRDDPEEYMDRVVTQDETWVHHFDPESKKKQSMQWNHAGSSPTKNFKRVSSVGKIMASIFLDYQ